MESSLIIYFDRCIGKAVPEALRLLDLDNVYHHHLERAKIGWPIEDRLTKLFAQEAPDHEWLDVCGKKGWVVVSQDYRLHLEEASLQLIEYYKVPVFYLWGANANKWDMMRSFVRAYDRIIETAKTTPRPFIVRIGNSGRLYEKRVWNSKLPIERCDTKVRVSGGDETNRRPRRRAERTEAKVR